MHRQSLRTRGFTLMELMVVVVIVGVMAALAIPSMRLATFDRHAYEDAGAVMQLFRDARTRSVARGSAVLVAMSSQGATDRGTFTMYEAVVGPGGLSSAQLSADSAEAQTPTGGCKIPMVWPVALPQPGDLTQNARFIESVNLNGTAESDADIETTLQAFLPVSGSSGPTSGSLTSVGSAYVCFTPLGHSYISGTTSFASANININPITVLVQRLGAGGSATGGRSVIILPNGSTRIYSHVGTP
ncbi:MAG TPA: prepilin-type N-terminal cleavage/methylation domain-containing protein [Polyangiaceae bacterium]|nr:prepilin-type N-terminal cleavage/methylation domain-containing protein [Polyangiaceae bacterium]